MDDSQQIWDWNAEPASCKDWKIGDGVWVNMTFYRVDAFDGANVILKRQDNPLRIRRRPSGYVSIEN